MKQLLILVCALLIAGTVFAQGKPDAKTDTVKTEVSKPVAATLPTAEELQAISTILDQAVQLISKSNAPANEADPVRTQLMQVKQFLQERYGPKPSATTDRSKEGGKP